jgi:hypothetical protein
MISKMTGENWTPAEVQETVWSWAKTAVEHADSFKGIATIPELVKDKDITDDLIRGTADFHTLFERPQHAATLAGSKFAEGARRLHDTQGQAAQQAPAGEARAAAASALAPHLMRAAKRLEEVRTNRAAAAAGP